MFTLPIVVNLSIAFFSPDGDRVGLQFQKTVEVVTIVLLPVLIGMLIRRLAPGVRAAHGQASADRFSA